MSVAAFASPHPEPERHTPTIDVPVVVTDVAGRPVPGLPAADFTLLQDGQPQQILTFAGFDGAAAKDQPPARMIIVIDSVNCDFEEMGYVRQGLQRFLREHNGHLAQPTTLARLSPAGVQFLAQPSVDGNALARVVASMGPTIQPQGIDALPVSLNALAALAAKEAGEPGRKVLVWLGPGWPTPTPLRPKYTGADDRDQRTYFAVAVDIAKRLREANMTLYGGYAGGAFYMRDFLKPVMNIAAMDARALRLNVLAMKSGGTGELPEINRDSVVTEELDRFAAEAASYYVLSYALTPGSAPGRSHTLQVNVRDPALTARTMTGFYQETAPPSSSSWVSQTPVPPENGQGGPGRFTQVTVAQLTYTLANSARRNDGQTAKQIETLRLTERLSTRKLSELRNRLHGSKSRAALTAIADVSAFLPPPAGEISDKPAPSLAEQKQIAGRVVDYLARTLPRLPNFYARRTTASFKTLEPEHGGTRLSAPQDEPLRPSATAVATVLYQDGQEVVRRQTCNRRTDEKAGLVTKGVFGPVLATVVGDTAHGKITWSRWEEGQGGLLAVFAYRIPEPQSHYEVSYASGKNVSLHDLTYAKSAYHGELAVDAETGAIVRISLEADLQSGAPLERAAVVVEYGATEIGGRTYTCPVRSVSLSIGRPTVRGDTQVLSYNHYSVTRLNDVIFDDYHLFRSEMRILPN